MLLFFMYTAPTGPRSRLKPSHGVQLFSCLAVVVVVVVVVPYVHVAYVITCSSSKLLPLTDNPLDGSRVPRRPRQAPGLRAHRRG